MEGSSLGDKNYVSKPVSSSIFGFLQEVKETFGEDPRLRTHVDHNMEEETFVYEYFKTDLLALVRNYPALPLTARKKILHEVGRALDAMHTRNWIHLGTRSFFMFANFR